MLVVVDVVADVVQQRGIGKQSDAPRARTRFLADRIEETKRELLDVLRVRLLVV